VSINAAPTDVPPGEPTGEITIGNTNHVGQSGEGVDNISVPINITGDNRFLAVGVSSRSTSSIDSIDFEGASLTEVCDLHSEDYHTEVWYLNDPLVLNGSVDIVFS